MEGAAHHLMHAYGKYLKKGQQKRIINVFQRYGKLYNIRIDGDEISATNFQRTCATILSKISTHFEEIELEAEQNKEKEHAPSPECVNWQWKVRIGSRKRAKRKLYNKSPMPLLGNEPTLVKEPLPLHLSLWRTEFHMITTEKQVVKLAQRLHRVDLFAYDLERTVPFVQHEPKQRICLLQISFEGADFILDVLEPVVHASVRKFLSIAFEDNNIQKVVHGNDDAKWLRDTFGIHVQNQYNSSSHGKLRNFVWKYCGIELAKDHQLSDWTERPLSNKMLEYARLDTHYLLMAYQNLVKSNK